MRLLLSRFRDALAFLSRLGSSPSPEGASLADAVPFFPLAGLVLGLCALCVALLVPPESWLFAWLYTLLLAWLTRGLHWDGVADLADACGSNAEGEQFWRIMKDSRIGAFGAAALVFGITGQILAAHTCASRGKWEALALAPAFGRAAVILFGRLTEPRLASSLAALIRPGVLTKTALSSAGLSAAVSLFLLGFPAFALAALLTFVCGVILARIASAHGGTNGDFHGALIVAAELAALLAASFC